MSELTPVPKGMCPAFYQFMGAGSPRSDSGEILMLKDKEAPDPAAELVAKAREAVNALRQLSCEGVRVIDLDSDLIADSLAAAIDAYAKGGAS